MLAYFTFAGRLNRQFVEQQLNLLVAVALLFRSDAQSRQQQSDVRPHCLLCAGRRPRWLLTKLRQHLVCLKTSDAMVLEHALDLGRTDSRRIWTRRNYREQVPQPRFIGCWTERKQRRQQPVNLLPQLIRQAAQLDLEIVGNARQLSESNDERV